MSQELQKEHKEIIDWAKRVEQRGKIFFKKLKEDQKKKDNSNPSKQLPNSGVVNNKY